MYTIKKNAYAILSLYKDNMYLLFYRAEIGSLLLKY